MKNRKYERNTVTKVSVKGILSEDASFVTFINDDKEEQVISIEQWSNKTTHKIIFDSIVDNYEMNKTQFDKILLNKSQIVILIKTEKDHYFGCYINGKIDKIRNWISPSNGFIFSFRNGMKMKYEGYGTEQYGCKRDLIVEISTDLENGK